jgi:hypothetical protein
MFSSAESASLVISTISAGLLTVAVMTTTPVDVALSKLFQADAANAAVFDLAHGVPAAEVANPKVLHGVRVESSTGDKIGQSTTATVGADGKVAVVGVTMGGGIFGVGSVVKKVDANDLIYLHARRTLVSRLTKSEIATLPEATIRKRTL